MTVPLASVLVFAGVEPKPPLIARFTPLMGRLALSVRRAVRVIGEPGVGTVGVAVSVICEPVIARVVVFGIPLIVVVMSTVRLDLSLPFWMVPVKTPFASVFVPPGVKTVLLFVVTLT